MRVVGKALGAEKTVYYTDAGEFSVYALPRGAWLVVWSGMVARFASRREAVEAVEAITLA